MPRDNTFQSLGLEVQFRHYPTDLPHGVSATVRVRKWSINNRNPLEQDLRVDCQLTSLTGLCPGVPVEHPRKARLGTIKHGNPGQLTTAGTWICCHPRKTGIHDPYDFLVG